MDAIATLSQHRCFGGVQGFYRHDSQVIGLPMKFGVFEPPQARDGPVPVVFYLAGLTCTEETFAIKAGAQSVAARLGLMLVTPDTSPRDTGIPGATGEWDFGEGAGFYLDALQLPWSTHFRMESYVTQELLDRVCEHFPARRDRAGVLGHSMGGHGAITLALRHPGLYRSVSALAPIASATRCPWGVKAFSRYLGSDQSQWAEYDATELIKRGGRVPQLLVDQGLADPFLQEQLRPDLLQHACRDSGQAITLHRHAGYDHGYYFVSSFIEDHLAHHFAALAG
jgi:S-formylglutathione hydrolase